VVHGHTGELRQGYLTGTEDQLGALGLEVNGITLWRLYVRLSDLLMRAGRRGADRPASQRVRANRVHPATPINE
jgi:hypothetical protein